MRTFTAALASAIVFLTVALAGCDFTTPDQQPQRTRPTTVQTVEVVVRACVIGEGGKADRRCDPGVVNVEGMRLGIRQTICTPNWTDTVRPSTSYTSPLRDEEMWLYYPPGTPTTSVRYDHVIPLELLGHATDRQNMWPQPVKASYAKNTEGGRLKDQVCAGTMTLAEAQRIIVERWTH